MTSSSVVEADVAAKRRALQDSLAELRARLAPAELSHEIGSGLTSRVAEAGQIIGDKASSPVGMVALCAMAFSSAFAMSGGLPWSKRDLPMSTKRLPDPNSPSRSSPVPTTDTLMMLLQLSAAVATGAVVSRFVPATEAERNLLAGVGPELKRTMQDRITEGAQHLVAPGSGSRFGLVNLLALGGTMLLTRKRS